MSGNNEVALLLGKGGDNGANVPEVLGKRGKECVERILTTPLRRMDARVNKKYVVENKVKDKKLAGVFRGFKIEFIYSYITFDCNALSSLLFFDSD